MRPARNDTVICTYVVAREVEVDATANTNACRVDSKTFMPLTRADVSCRIEVPVAATPCALVDGQRHQSVRFSAMTKRS